MISEIDSPGYLNLRGYFFYLYLQNGRHTDRYGNWEEVQDST